MRSYKQWISWLEARSIMPVVKPGLENTRRALMQTDLLELIDAKKVIHIAGTNGKGTTAKTLEQLLLSQNKAVGLFTSPHLIDTCERIRVNDQNISETDFVRLCEKYKNVIEEWNLSHFESLTLFAFDYFFKDQKVDIAIFEIGLGGTWDSTNAIPHATSVITTLGFDHMHILGHTLEEIAENKFGIIQEGNTVLHLPYSKSIEEQLQRKIAATHAHEVPLPPPQFVIDKTQNLPAYILQTPWGSVRLSLMGERAVQTMWLALHVFKALGFNPSAALEVLSTIRWEARMTPLNCALAAPVYLSGDHNIQGLKSLVEILENANYEKVYFILGLSKNRQHDEFLEVLRKIPRSTILLTRPEFNGVYPTNEMDHFFEKPHLALESLKSKVTAQDLVIVTGSLYLCGDLLRA